MQYAGAIRLRTPFSYCTSHFDENVFSNTNTYLYYWGHGGRSFILHLYKHGVLAALLRTDSSDVAPEICWSHSGNHTCHCSFYHWDHWDLPHLLRFSPQYHFLMFPEDSHRCHCCGLLFLVKHRCLVGWPVSAFFWATGPWPSDVSPSRSLGLVLRLVLLVLQSWCL